MMGTPASYTIGQILPKLQDADPDLRYMGLNDLSKILSNSPQGVLSLASDYTTAARTADALVTCLQDSNGEVQNMAVRCLGPYVNRAPEIPLCVLIEKISMLPSESVVDASIPALALRQVVVSLPRPISGVPRSKQVQEAYSAISRAMIPRLTGYIVLPRPGQENLPKPPDSMLTKDLENGTDSNAMDVLMEVANCFGPMLKEAEVTALTKVSLKVIQNTRTGQVLKKKAAIAIAHFAVHFTDNLLELFIGQVMQDLSTSSMTKVHRKMYFLLLGGVARSIPENFAPYLASLAPHLIGTLSQEEIDNDMQLMEEIEERDPEADELRELALLALEAWIESCTDAMKPFTKDCLQIILRFLKYDPNLADGGADDMDEEEDALAGDDFEEDNDGDDEDDTSWKVRRCAAKVAHVLITIRSNGDLLEDGTLYSTIAPALISRFKEREETVRLEVLNALSTLIRITGGEATGLDITASSAAGAMPPPPSRKRRRGGSDASMLDSQPHPQVTSGPADGGPKPPSSCALQSLHRISNQIVIGLSHLMSTGHLATKQASVVVLKDLVLALHGRLSGYLALTIPTMLNTIKQTGAATTTSVAANNAYRIDALGFLGAAAEVQTAQELQPFLFKLLPVVITALKDRYTKVSTAALTCVEQFINVLTPPRTPGLETQPALVQLLESLSQLASSNDADLEVRRLAIHAIGMLLGQSATTSGLLPADARSAGMQLLLNRLLNETTRLSAARAVETVATFARDASDYPNGWVQAVSDALVEQFRKSSRALRGASVSAMKMLAINPGSNLQFNSQSISCHLPELEPLIQSSDFHLLNPALLILAVFVEKDPENEKIATLIQPLCKLFVIAIPSSTMKALISVVRAYGTHGVGEPLMTALLRDVSLNASPDIVGKAIGNLLVAGGTSVGVKVDSFISELDSQPDERRKCLALAVLAETACIMGPKSSLTPQFFVERLARATEPAVAQAAAAALGRAGAGNISVYVPVILATISGFTTSKDKQLILLSIREIVNSDNHGELEPFAQALWNEVMTASQSDEGKAIGAESIGLLVIFEPEEFFPQLQSLLSSPTSNPSLRHLVLSALRVTVTSDAPAAHTRTVTAEIIPLLRTVLEIIPHEVDLENRRVALTIIDAAAHSRLDDVLVPMLLEIIPVVLQETKIRKELIREVPMGPFKHKVDDGLEVRKVSLPLSHANFSVNRRHRPPTNVSTHSSRTLFSPQISSPPSRTPWSRVSVTTAKSDSFRSCLYPKPRKCSLWRLHP
jgi:cullin-associated NEDD8-dissociated protein 1